jgi:hypothetical protein
VERRSVNSLSFGVFDNLFQIALNEGSDFIVIEALHYQNTSAKHVTFGQIVNLLLQSGRGAYDNRYREQKSLRREFSVPIST